MSISPLLGASPLATAARLYQSLGLSVLPWTYSETNQKKPQRRWQVGDYPPMTAEDVEAWWKMHPDHNVGVITGPTRSRDLVLPTDIVVLDLDSPEALEWAKANLPDTPWKVTTGREGGGQHWGYRYPVLPEGQYIKTQTCLFGVRGLDIRGFGGYVSMPPSLHKSGKTYEWQQGTFDVRKLPVLNTQLIPPTTRETVSSDNEELDETPASETVFQRAKEWLAQQAPAIEGQRGDSYTFKVCAALRRGYALNMDQCWAIIDEWNDRCDPPWDGPGLERKFIKARQEGTEDMGRRGVSPSHAEIMAAFANLPEEKLAPPEVLASHGEPEADTDPLNAARDRAFQIPGDVQFDIGAPFETENIQAAATLYRKDQPAYHRLRAELRNCGAKFSLKDWEREVAKAAKTAAVAARPINETGNRKRVVVTGDEKAMCDSILKVLKDSPSIYVRDNALCYIADGEVQPLRKERLRNAIVQMCNIVKPVHDKTTEDYIDVPAPLPATVVGMLSELLPEQVAMFRVVDQIATYPFCSESDGYYRLVTQEGYDEASRTVLSRCPEIDMDRFGSAQSAVRYLLWLLQDFPFVSASERENFISAMITVVVRPAIRGVSPMILIEGNQPDVGKSLLAKLLVSLSGICPAELTPWPDEGVKEATKKILPVLRRSQAVHAWDNVRGKLESTQLEGTLTSMVISLRTLGVSSDETYPNKTLWVLTANNMDANRDMARRSMRVRLVRVAAPAAHEIDDFEQYIYRERGTILAAILKIVEDWIDKGAKEAFGLPRIGSFESWSTVVGAIMHNAGLNSWLTNYKEAQMAMSQGDDWQQFVDAWYTEFKTAQVSATQLWMICQKTMLLSNVLGDGSDRSQQTRLGDALRRQHQAVFDGLQVLRVPQRANSSGYRLVRVGLTSVQEESKVQTGTTEGSETKQSAA